jgi:hypothetical protein
MKRGIQHGAGALGKLHRIPASRNQVSVRRRSNPAKIKTEKPKMSNIPFLHRFLQNPAHGLLEGRDLLLADLKRPHALNDIEEFKMLPDEPDKNKKAASRILESLDSCGQYPLASRQERS